MCGIVGIMQFDKKGITGWDYDMFFELLYADALRGMHGTGVLAIDKQGTSQMAKVGGPPHQLVATPEFRAVEDFVKKRRCRFLLGHNRYATRGKKITAHSHPFRQGNIILVHNGTLDSLGLTNWHSFDVDSEALCASIDKHGIEETVMNMRGAWTIVYWDRKELTFNLIRNAERPLYMATYGDDKKFFAFASEQEMLEWVLDRNHFWDIKIEEVPVDTLFTWKLNDPKPEIKEGLKGRPPLKTTDWKKSLKEAFGETSEAAGTTEKAERTSDIKDTMAYPVIPSPSAYNKASTGKVGKVTPIMTKKGKFLPVQVLHELKKNDVIGVELYGYDPISRSGTSQKLFLVEFYNELYPDIEFHAYLKEQDMDKILNSKLGSIGVIANILESQENVATTPHRVYLHDLEPVSDGEEPKNIPPYALL